MLLFVSTDDLSADDPMDHIGYRQMSYCPFDRVKWIQILPLTGMVSRWCVLLNEMQCGSTAVFAS